MTYKFVKAPSDYPGKVYSFGNRILEHHLVWWRNTGTVVPNGYVLHHINGKKKDNRFENLEMKLAGKHISDHHKIHEDFELTCPICKVVFTRNNRTLKKAKNNYCSNKCSATGTNNFRSKAISDEMKRSIKNLKENNFSSYKIAELLSISRNTVMKYWQ